MLVSCGFAAAFTVVLVSAEVEFRMDTVTSTAHAARMGSAQYHERLAELDEQNGPSHLRNAVKANPRAAVTWIALGLALERTVGVQTGNGEAGRAVPARRALSRETLAEAKQALEHAARIDRQYLPAWTLANFAFRQEDAATFWRAARSAAARAYDNRRPLIELADRMDREPEIALDRLEAAAPVERDYLDFLIGQQRLDDATKVARRMLRSMPGSIPQRGVANMPGVAPRVNDVPGAAGDAMRLADFTGRLLEAQRPREAIEIWSGLGRFPRIGAGLSLTNGDFEQAPSGLGFDWRLVAAEGVQASWRPHAMQFELSGAQPEVCALLEQWVVASGQRRRLSFEYAWRGTAPDQHPSILGLRWAWASSAPAATIVSPPLEPTWEWRSANWEFTPPKPGAERLRLIYRREPGETRAAGKLLLRRLRLDVLYGPPAATGAL